MTKYAAMLIAIFIGSITSIQTAINTDLGKHVGTLTSALVSFAVGTLTLAIFYIFLGEKGLNGVLKVPPYLLVGGVLGATFVFGMIKLVPFIGVSGSISGVIAGQLILAMLIDHFGWFGLTAYHINLQRIIAAVLLLISVNLMGKS